jgi:hypothetical protein
MSAYVVATATGATGTTSFQHITMPWRYPHTLIWRLRRLRDAIERRLGLPPKGYLFITSYRCDATRMWVTKRQVKRWTPPSAISHTKTGEQV